MTAEILEDYQHPEIKFPQTKRLVQLDVFIPSQSLAFEYQGEQHYQDIGIFQPSRVYQQQDQQKRALCEKYGIKLIEVPYWWNRTQEGLQDIIRQAKQEPITAHATSSTAHIPTEIM